MRQFAAAFVPSPWGSTDRRFVPGNELLLAPRRGGVNQWWLFSSVLHLLSGPPNFGSNPIWSGAADMVAGGDRALQ